MDITIDQDARDIGLANMLADLLMQNIEAHPERRRLFDGLGLRVAVAARDVDVAITLDFDRGRLVVLSGVAPDAEARIEGTSDAILELPMLRIGRLGLPVLWDKTGRAILRRTFRGELRLRGLRALGRLTTLTRLLSVAGSS